MLWPLNSHLTKVRSTVEFMMFFVADMLDKTPPEVASALTGAVAQGKNGYRHSVVYI